MSRITCSVERGVTDPFTPESRAFVGSGSAVGSWSSGSPVSVSSVIEPSSV